MKSNTENPTYKAYKKLKKEYHDRFILFRCDNCYEMYADDAKEAVKILGISLIDKNDDIATAAFPHFAIDTYLPKLIRAGKRVSISDPF